MSRLYFKKKSANAAGIAATLGKTEKYPSRLNFINSKVLRSHVRSWFNRSFFKNNGDSIAAASIIDNKLAFVFQGRNGNYTQLGQAFYKENLVFRESIQKCHEVCINKFDFDLLRVFQDKNFDLKTASEPEIFVSLSCIQCALTDFYYSKNIIPEVIIAMSLGEAAAGYAAGGYSLEDAVSIAFYIFDTCTHMAEQCTLFMLDLSAEELSRLIKESAGTLIHFAEFTLKKRVLICSDKHFETVSAILLKNNISNTQLKYHGAYHTPYSIDAINKARTDIMAKFGSVHYTPLEIPFHTCLYEKKFPAGHLLDGTFWIDMLTSPVLFGRVITNEIGNGFNIFLNVGAHPKLSEDIEACASDLNKRVTILDSFKKGEPELSLIKETLKELETLIINPKSAVPSTPSNDGDHSPGFMSPDFFKDPYPYYEVLRNNSRIQFLKKQNYWLVLNYTDVDFALKNPVIFSSVPAKGLDAILLGAEPLDHGRARKLMAPFFKNASIVSLSGFIQDTAETLIENIQNKNFDIVNDYAIPLTEKVVSHLIGLNSEAFTEIQKVIGSNKYELSYIPALETFFSTYLKKYENSSDDSLCAQLLNNNNENGFTCDELTSILKLLWVAGTTTTSMLISSSVLILLTQPVILKDLQSDFSKFPLFIEEVLRFESPEQTSWRTTNVDIDVSGIVIPRNSEVRLCLASANRDSLIFKSPNEFRPDRNPKKHLAFAAGPHYCLGAELARLEARIAIETLLKKCPSLHLKTMGDDIEYLHSDHFRAIKNMAVAT